MPHGWRDLFWFGMKEALAAVRVFSKAAVRSEAGTAIHNCVCCGQRDYFVLQLSYCFLGRWEQTNAIEHYVAIQEKPPFPALGSYPNLAIWFPQGNPYVQINSEVSGMSCEWERSIWPPECRATALLAVILGMCCCTILCCQNKCVKCRFRLS